MKKIINDRIRNHRLYKRTIENRNFILLLIIILTLITFNYFSHGFIYELVNNDLESTIDFINRFEGFSWLIYILIIIIEVILAPIPGIVLNAAGGIIFGPWIGGTLALIGNIMGATICYFIAKRYGGFYFEKLIGEKRFNQFHKSSEKYGGWVLFTLRLNPLTSSDVFSYLAGFIKMSYKKFIIATTLALIPLTFIQAYFGDVLIKESPFLRLFFIFIALIYFLIFAYGYYKIGKEKVKEKLRR